MGSVGANISIAGFQSKVEKLNKRWDPGDRDNLDYAFDYMAREFGDFSDLIDTIKKRSGNWDAIWDEWGLEGKGKNALLFNSGKSIQKDIAVHELVHVVAEEIAENAKALGFDPVNTGRTSRDLFFETARSEVYKNLGREEPKYDGRRWDNRAGEFFSIHIQDGVFQSLRGNPTPEIATEALKVLKKYWRQYKKLPETVKQRLARQAKKQEIVN